jgi:hypothetical protein
MARYCTVCHLVAQCGPHELDSSVKTIRRLHHREHLAVDRPVSAHVYSQFVRNTFDLLRSVTVNQVSWDVGR